MATSSIDCASPPASDRPKRVWTCAGVLMFCLVAAVIYMRTIHYDLIFDDVPSIVENDSIHQLWPLFGESGGYGPLKPQPKTPVTARPLINLAFAINYHFGGENPRGYRIAHMVMHVLAALVLWSIVAKTLQFRQFSGAVTQHRNLLGFGSALIWMVHPCHNETVVYLTQRTELMMGLFYLLTLYLSIRYWETKRSVSRWTWLSLATLAGIAGMLCKEMMASVPAMVLIYEWTFLCQSDRHTGGQLNTAGESIGSPIGEETPLARLRTSWPLYVGLAMCWLPIIAIYQAGYTTPLAGFNNIIPAVDWWMTQANTFFIYWKLTWFPWPLLMNYQVLPMSSLTEAWPGVLGLAVYSIITTRLVWRRSTIGFVMLWYFAVLSPTLIVPLPTEEIAERRLYVPLAAFAPVFVIGLYLGCCRIATSQATNNLRDRGLIASQTATMAIAAIFTIIGVYTLPRLSSRLTIWKEVLKYEPDNVFAYMNQGCVEFNEGRKDAGIAMIQTAFEARPAYKHGVLTLARVLENTKQHERLVDVFRKASQANPNEPMYHYNLGVWLEMTGQSNQAIEAYEATLLVDPRYETAHTNLACLLATKHNLITAIEHFEAAVEINPDFANCTNLLNAYLQTKQTERVTLVAKKMLVAASKEGKLDVAKQIQRTITTFESQSVPLTQNR